MDLDTKSIRDHFGESLKKAYIVEVVFNLCDEVDRLRARTQKLETSLREFRDEVSCHCDEAYTNRGRHEPNSLCLLAEVIDEDLKG